MRIHLHKGGIISPEHLNLMLIILLLAMMGSAIFYYGESFRMPSQHITAVPMNVPL
ncbi:hypothetical protein [Bradyrhizobium sp. dw_78]|uniref:hypothetical protein n=1 Tax=Bradyrhizobium sp. dw_78 TaxID=2719793 RepID=UPI001BD5CABB|nr:hypothetical protein [Bradyrhizobium sp. dw_78]